METIQVICYCDAPNSMVVQTPDRSFPGMVLQGDSMRILCTKAESGIESFDAGNVSEAREYLSEIAEELRDRLKTYEKVLELHGIKLPYIRPVNTQGAK